jgi:hypothetical protein
MNGEFNLAVYFFFSLVLTFLLYIHLSHKQEKELQERLVEKHGEVDEASQIKSFDKDTETITCSVCGAENRSEYKYCWHCTNRFTENRLPKT